MTNPISTIVLKLAASGMQRAVSVVFQKVLRVQRIDKALKGASSRPNVEAALSDFETVIGTLYGNLTVPLKEFLTELEKTAIVDAMMENALLGRDAKSARDLFSDLHKRFIADDVLKSTVLFEQLMISFRVTIDEIMSDDTIVAFLRAGRKEMLSRLDALDASIQDISGRKLRQKSFDEIQPALARLARGLLAQYRDVRIETNKGPREIDISKIYIAPKLSVRPSARSPRQRIQLNLPRLEPRSIDHILPPGRLGGEVRYNNLSRIVQVKVNQSVYVPFVDLLSGFRRVVVLGDPGGGKSTLCQRICYDLTKNAANVFQYGEREHIAAQLQKIPVRIILRLFEKARQTDPQLDLFEYIARDVRHVMTGDEFEIRDVLEYILTTGRAALAFDGLDEILDTSQRRMYVELVRAFVAKYPLCPVLVTSRLVGYDDAPLPGEFEELVLQRFDEKEVREYAQKFIQHVGFHTVDEAVDRAELFIAQTERNASDLRRNPLMLGLMVWLYVARGDVPTNRPEIYQECALLMFERWDPGRGIYADIPSDFDKLHLFSQIAARIYSDPILRGGVERAWLQAVLREFFSKTYEDKARAYSTALSLLNFIVGRAWVMSEVGDGVFAFTHQTFLEYFFARNLNESYDTVTALLKVLKPKIVKSEWDVVSHLALQLKTYRNVRRQEEAIDALIKYIKSAKSRRELDAIMLFSTRALEYLSASEGKIKILILEILSHSLEKIAEGDLTAGEYIDEAVSSARDRRDYIRKVIVDALAREVTRGGDVVPSGLMLLVGGGGVPVSRRKRVSASGLPEDLAAEVRDRSRDAIVRAAPKSALYAGLAWAWFGVVEEGWVRKHGLPAYFRWPMCGGLPGVDGLTSTAFAAARNLGEYYQGNVSISDARRALKIFGRVGFENYPFHIFENKEARPFYPVPEHLYEEILVELREDVELAASISLVGNFAIGYASQLGLIERGGWSGLNSTDRRTNVGKINHDILSSETGWVGILRERITEVISGKEVLWLKSVRSPSVVQEADV